jgi:hypothetical protein
MSNMTVLTEPGIIERTAKVDVGKLEKFLREDLKRLVASDIALKRRDIEDPGTAVASVTVKNGPVHEDSRLFDLGGGQKERLFQPQGTITLTIEARDQRAATAILQYLQRKEKPLYDLGQGDIPALIGSIAGLVGSTCPVQPQLGIEHRHGSREITVRIHWGVHYAPQA